MAIAVSALAETRERADSTRTHFELGFSSDVTNESFYEATFDDTLFLKRTLQGAPEARSAAVWLARVEGTRSAGAETWFITQDLSLGDQVQKGGLGGAWRAEHASGWRVGIDPRVEFRRDRSFDLARDEWRAALSARFRREFSDGASHVEAIGRSDILRVGGPTPGYLLDHQAGGIALDWLHSRDLAQEWRLASALDVRAFPDSALRDHREIRLGIEWRRLFDGGPSLAVECEWRQRRTLNDGAESSRDRFDGLHVTASGDAMLVERFGWSVGGEIDAIYYAMPDSMLDFDYARGALRAGPRLMLGGSTSIAAGVEFEHLASAWNPSEAYSDWSGFVNTEWMPRSAYWSLRAAAGRRVYPGTAGSGSDLSAHSPFAWYELEAVGEQPIPARMRLRVTAIGRSEVHDERSDDSRSLYFSVDVRRLF